MPVRLVLLAALAALALLAHAQPDDELRRLREALAAIQQEQQAVYQQFQMVQGLRGSDTPPAGAPGALVYTPPATPPNFEDLARERAAFDARQSRYRDELDRLYARYRELEERKRPLVERMAEIASTPR
jgi:hypothetical protein